MQIGDNKKWKEGEKKTQPTEVEQNRWYTVVETKLARFWRRFTAQKSQGRTKKRVSRRPGQ